MEKDLHKRLDEAAEEYAETYKASLQKTAFRSFLAGAEYGYKEAIAQAKAWLNFNFYDIANTDSYSNREYPTNIECLSHWTMKDMLADFEAGMLKLWEDKK